MLIVNSNNFIEYLFIKSKSLKESNMFRFVRTKQLKNQYYLGTNLRIL